jgi:hypothetical protein
VARRNARAVDLAGARVLSSAGAVGFNARPGDVVIHLQLPAGPQVELMLDQHDADLLAAVLGGLPAASPEASADPPGPGRRWWAVLLLVLSGLWLAYCLSMFVTGYSARVTVTGGDGEGICDVVWRDAAGMTHRGEADCSDEPSGSRLDVRVTGWPEPGDPTTPWMYVGIAAMVGLPPTAVGALRLRYLRSQQRLWAALEMRS